MIVFWVEKETTFLKVDMATIPISGTGVMVWTLFMTPEIMTKFLSDQVFLMLI